MVGPVGWLFRRFSRKKISWGLHGERIINNMPTALLAPWRPQCSRSRPPWRPSGCQKCYGGSYWGSIHSLQKNWGCRGARIINRNHHNNFNSLKASMVTGFADMPREETTLLLMNRSPLQPPRLLFFWKPANESSTGATKTLRTPWRPPWRPHSRTCPGRRVRSPSPTTTL